MEETNTNRRSFLRGAALAGTAALVTGPAAMAQEKGKGFVFAKTPAGDNAPEDTDLEESLKPLAHAALSEAMSKVDSVIEKSIRKGSADIDVSKALAAEGLALKSPGAMAAAKRLSAPGLKKKAAAGKAEGWHAHICWLSIAYIGCVAHSHASW